MIDTPSFVPLLNSIAVNESKGEQLLCAWAQATGDETLGEALKFVAIREGEHAWAFRKRLCEIGFDVSEEDAYQVFQDFPATLACLADEQVSDAQKIQQFMTAQRPAKKINNPEDRDSSLGDEDSAAARTTQHSQSSAADHDKDSAPDPFSRFFNDTSIDPTTGALLGRYICEERDSGRILKAQFERINSQQKSAQEKQESLDEIADLRRSIASLQEELEQLRALRSVA